MLRAAHHIEAPLVHRHFVFVIEGFVCRAVDHPRVKFGGVRWGGGHASGRSVRWPTLTMPTAEERAEMRALDAKLDALAAKLKG